MRNLLVVVSALVALVVFPASSSAQFGLGKIKGGLATVGEKTGIVKEVSNNEETDSSISSSVSTKLRDGDVAVIQTALSVDEATRVVKDYFDNTLKVEYATRETGWITTDRYKVRFSMTNVFRGPHDVNNIASARVVSRNGTTQVEVRVAEQRQRSEPELKGEPTAELARKLEVALSGERVTAPALASAPPLLTPAVSKIALSAPPKTIDLGLSEIEVRSILGEPQMIGKGKASTTYLYTNMKVVFVNGKVDDIQ